MSDLDALAGDLLKAAATVQREAPVVVGYAGARTVQAARSGAAVLTGELRDSITARAALGGLSVLVEATSEHAPYNEYGTSKMAPQPFMRPAADQAEPDLAEALEALGGDIL